MTALSSAALPALAGRARVPGYDRARVTAGIVHVGVGGFHRAHQALYLDRLIESAGELDLGICGVGVLARDQAMKEGLEAQDCLYTLRGDPSLCDRGRRLGALRRGVDEDGDAFEVVDALGNRLAERARRQRTDPNAFIADRELFGDLVENERFVAAYRAALTSLHEQGVRRTVESLVDTTG